MANESPVGFRRWAIVLAGGEGERMRSYTMRCFGRPRPKQYCTFVGSRSMLQHTLDRAGRLVPSDQIVTVIGKDHRAFLQASCRSPFPGRVIEQPANRDTAPGILLAAAYIQAADPAATVLIFPSDHFISPEARFLRHAGQAALLAEQHPGSIVLLGATPRSPEVEYGWVRPGRSLAGPHESAPRAVSAFREKPDAAEAARFYRSGYLWNTMIMATSLVTLWSLGRYFLPKTTERFQSLGSVIAVVNRGAAGREHESLALSHLYRNLQRANFSSDILQRAPERALILEMDDVDWDDWGRPARIAESLARLHKTCCGTMVHA
ncbi:MAG: NTP transferase domain-containing protein [Acidobacteria bacterium]|nr:NTP transferase domain-containing protein [Acidobacteriota bacterium]